MSDGQIGRPQFEHDTAVRRSGWNAQGTSGIGAASVSGADDRVLRGIEGRMVALPEGAVTVLFTDVEGSTDLRTRLGDEAADELLRLHEEIVRDRVVHHGGHEIKALGDGFMVAFASPRKAISCAVEIQRALGDRNRADPGRELRVRIGINAGEVSEKAGDLFGAAVNAAARIAGKARGGQILIANVVKDLAGMRPDISYLDRGLFWLKGFPERWRLFEVL